METASERLFFDGDEYFDALIEAIHHAKSSIDLETYIFSNDTIGKRMTTALVRAAHRGARVRVMVDGFGSRHFIRKLAETLDATPVQFRVYRPVHWNLSLFVRKTFQYLSRRNHRKTCVIDAKSAWLGSFNISDVHTRANGTGPWRDSAICIRGHDSQGFAELQTAFDRAWEGHRFHAAKPLVGATVRGPSHFLLNSTLRLRRRRNARLVREIRKARRLVWVTTPYFSPSHAIRKALRIAAAAGADVRVLLPRRSDVMGMDWVNAAFYRLLFPSVVQVYLYHASFLHAKTVLTDHWAIIGSSNLNHRSLFQDLEADAIVTKKHSLDALEAQFMKDLETARLMRPRDLRARSFLTRVLDRLALWLRGWT